MKKIRNLVLALMLMFVGVISVNAATLTIEDVSKQFDKSNIFGFTSKVNNTDKTFDIYDNDEKTFSFTYGDDYLEYDNREVTITPENSANSMIPAFLIQNVLESVITLSGYTDKTLSEAATYINTYDTYGIQLEIESYNFSGSDENGSSWHISGEAVKYFKISLDTEKIDALIAEYGTDIEEDSNESEKEEEQIEEIKVNDKIWKEFLTELTKTYGKIDYSEDYVIFTTGDEHTYTIGKFDYKDGILNLNIENSSGDLLENMIQIIVKYAMNDSKYGEKDILISSMFEPYKEYGLNNIFTLKNDGIEYVIKHPLTEEEQANNTCTICRYTPIFESFAIDLKNGLNMENLKKFHKGINAYKYLDGEQQTFNINSKKQLTFRIDADFKLFDGIYIDGEEVDKKYYIITEGSTIVTFTDEYSKKLGDGDHTLKVTFTDGKQAITEFKIDTKIENVSTGINLGFGILTLIIIISGIGYFLIRKQSKFPKYN